MSDTGSPPQKPEGGEHLNIKVTDNNNEVYFKIKRTTQLKKLMDAFCERQGKAPQTVRFLFDGTRVNPTDNPESVSLRRESPYPYDGILTCSSLRWRTATRSKSRSWM